MLVAAGGRSTTCRDDSSSDGTASRPDGTRTAPGRHPQPAKVCQQRRCASPCLSASNGRPSGMSGRAAACAARLSLPPFAHGAVDHLVVAALTRIGAPGHGRREEALAGPLRPFLAVPRAPVARCATTTATFTADLERFSAFAHTSWLSLRAGQERRADAARHDHGSGCSQWADGREGSRIDAKALMCAGPRGYPRQRHDGASATHRGHGMGTTSDMAGNANHALATKNLGIKAYRSHRREIDALQSRLYANEYVLGYAEARRQGEIGILVWTAINIVFVSNMGRTHVLHHLGTDTTTALYEEGVRLIGAIDAGHVFSDCRRGVAAGPSALRGGPRREPGSDGDASLHRLVRVRPSTCSDGSSFNDRLAHPARRPPPSRDHHRRRLRAKEGRPARHI